MIKMTPNPKTLPRHWTQFVAWTAAIALSGCATYTVKEKRPEYPSPPNTSAGQIMVQALHERQAEAAVGHFLDAAALAYQELKERPGDTSARRDYNFAVGRVFESLHDAKLSPWKGGLNVASPGGNWHLVGTADKRPEQNPELYYLLPADRYRFNKDYEKSRAMKDGVGAPLVVTGRDRNFLTRDRFAQGKQVYYGVTGLLTFSGRRAMISFEDPLAVETVSLAGHRQPLAADFTAPVAMALVKEDVAKLGIPRLLNPGKFAETARLARLQPYDPKKIPVLVVHGLMSSPITWAPLITTLRADPEIRKHYQIWFYSYPSGYPYPYSASILRQQLDEIGRRYPGHKKIVVIGHSMGAVISRTLLLDSGMTLWNNAFQRSPAECNFSPATRQMLEASLIFKARQDIGRAILVCGPHRGSETAGTWIGRLGSRFIRLPQTLLAMSKETVAIAAQDPSATHLRRVPTSVDTLAPQNRFVVAVNQLPMTTKVPYHSIIGDRGKGGNKDKTAPVIYDGIVPYWSAHLDGAASELVIPSNHAAHEHPAGMAEIRRILHLHLRGK
jgi:pimeloyl-ACP methyl ester carboxylesterase